MPAQWDALAREAAAIRSSPRLPGRLHAAARSAHASGRRSTSRLCARSCLQRAMGRRAERARRRGAALREGPFLRRVRVRLGVGRRLRAPRPRYYPKLLVAGAVHAGAGRAAARRRRRPHARALARRSSLQRAPFGAVVAARALPAAERGRGCCALTGLLERKGVQFHWHNAGYVATSTISSPRSRTTSARRSAQERRRCATPA